MITNQPSNIQIENIIIIFTAALMPVPASKSAHLRDKRHNKAQNT
jgi:hypothetical protein